MLILLRRADTHQASYEAQRPGRLVLYAPAGRHSYLLPMRFMVAKRMSSQDTWSASLFRTYEWAMRNVFDHASAKALTAPSLCSPTKETPPCGATTAQQPQQILCPKSRHGPSFHSWHPPAGLPAVRDDAWDSKEADVIAGHLSNSPGLNGRQAGGFGWKRGGRRWKATSTSPLPGPPCDRLRPIPNNVSFSRLYVSCSKH